MIQRHLIDPIWTTEPRGFAARLIRHQCVALPVVILLVSLNHVSPPLPSENRATLGSRGAAYPVTVTAVAGASGSMHASGAVAVAPTGWRKTNDGWQHVSQWHDSPSKTMRQTLQQQPTKVDRSFSRIGRIAPWNIAMLQIGAIALIFLIAKRIGRRVGASDLPIELRRSEPTSRPTELGNSSHYLVHEN